MSPEHWRQVDSLYHAALEKDPAHRSAFLIQATHGNEELRREVESLLAQDISKEGRLDHPAWQDNQPDVETKTVAAGLVAPGTRLGPYRVEAMLGAGGMGQVHKAVDMRLQRAVAIKVLNAEFSDRFEREARAIALLNHPNICTLYDVGANFLVMELLEGEPLSARLQAGPLPLDLAIRYGVQIADALAVAHTHGVIHRDLKPGNVMVTKSVAKVLDFGLAKVSSDPNRSVTGGVVGTPAYMAPEQRTGGQCTEQTDIYAFGLVLYEMAAGRRADPSLPRPDGLTGLPQEFTHIVERCLAADPDDRWHSARDVKAELEWCARTGPQQPPASVRRSPRLAIGAILLAALAVAAAFILGRKAMRGPELTYRTAILLPQGMPIANDRGSTFALSPDGRWLAIAAGGRLWLRSLDSDTVRPLEGSEDAASPFWSPDSKQLGFFTGTHLKRIAVTGGAAITLAEAQGYSGGSWNKDGVIIFGTFRSPLKQIPASGGTPSPVTSLDAEAGENYHNFPFFLPDGHHFLYAALGTKAHGPFDANGVFVGSLSASPPKRILSGASSPQYAQGYLLYERQGALVAHRFDIGRKALAGDATVLAKDIDSHWHFSGFPTGAYSVSTGALVYREMPASFSQLALLDRAGKQVAKLGEKEDYAHVSLAPDGAYAAVTARDRNNRMLDIWIWELARGVRTRLTSSGNVGLPTWSPDGKRLVYRANRHGSADLYQKAINGAGEEQLLWKDSLTKHPTHWSADGRFILYFTGISTVQTSSDIWALPLFGAGKPFPVLKGAFTEQNATLSPDGRWMAYTSTESGQEELYVSGFPSLNGRQRLSPGRTIGRAHWRRDGREVYYLAPGNRIMAVAVNGRGLSFVIESERLLLELPGPIRGWDVSADGQRFLVNLAPNETNAANAMTVVLNWLVLLEQNR